MSEIQLEYDGVVTKVDPMFAFIELDHHTRVHMSIFIIDNHLLNFPKVGSKFSIGKAHKYNSTYILCDTSYMKGDFTEHVESLFYKFIKVIN
ncbi:hypothetical protein JTB14_004542 [Gonioctena quinquepunctata]|nr:hypothetical protein JTB14_004542 [Gonioctena quinquepunctata]